MTGTSRRSRTRLATRSVREPTDLAYWSGDARDRVHSGVTVDDDLIRYVREAFGWGDGVAVARGPRGALGQIWRVEVGAGAARAAGPGPHRFALKEIFFEPPSEAL